MKKIIFALVVLLAASQANAFGGPDFPDVKATLLRFFERNFPNAENVHWTDDPNGFTVSFTVKGILTRINYDKRGKFTGSLRNYSEQMMPFYLVNLLKQHYTGQEIFGITEVTSPTDIVYFVKLESDRYWTTVQVTGDGTMVVTDRYRKAN